ncbi:hypothetical protein Tco_0666392 [Tanacetum coccineum]
MDEGRRPKKNRKNKLEKNRKKDTEFKNRHERTQRTQLMGMGIKNVNDEDIEDEILMMRNVEMRVDEGGRANLSYEVRGQTPPPPPSPSDSVRAHQLLAHLIVQLRDVDSSHVVIGTLGMSVSLEATRNLPRLIESGGRILECGENATLKKKLKDKEMQLVIARMDRASAERRIMPPKPMSEARMREIIRDQVTTSMNEFMANMNRGTGSTGTGGAGTSGAGAGGDGTVVRLGINPMIQPELEDLPKDNPKLEIAVLRYVERITKKRTKNKVKTTKLDSEWKRL